MGERVNFTVHGAASVASACVASGAPYVRYILCAEKQGEHEGVRRERETGRETDREKENAGKASARGKERMRELTESDWARKRVSGERREGGHTDGYYRQGEKIIRSCARVYHAYARLSVISRCFIPGDCELIYHRRAARRTKISGETPEI